jgi:hypothetical protein
VATPFKDKGSNAIVALTLDIAPAALQFAEKSGQHEAVLEIRHLAADARNKLYPEFRHTSTLTLSPAAHQRVVENGSARRFGIRAAARSLSGARRLGQRWHNRKRGLRPRRPRFRQGPRGHQRVALTSGTAADVFTMQAMWGIDLRSPEAAVRRRASRGSRWQSDDSLDRPYHHAVLFVD